MTFGFTGKKNGICGRSDLREPEDILRIVHIKKMIFKKLQKQMVYKNKLCRCNSIQSRGINNELSDFGDEFQCWGSK